MGTEPSDSSSARSPTGGGSSQLPRQDPPPHQDRVAPQWRLGCTWSFATLTAQAPWGSGRERTRQHGTLSRVISEGECSSAVERRSDVVRTWTKQWLYGAARARGIRRSSRCDGDQAQASADQDWRAIGPQKPQPSLDHRSLGRHSAEVVDQAHKAGMDGSTTHPRPAADSTRFCSSLFDFTSGMVAISGTSVVAQIVRRCLIPA